MKVFDVYDGNVMDGRQIIWEDLVNDNVKGLIIKVSEGCTLQDYFNDIIGGCKEYGLQWGVYCLTHARTTERAKQEADTLLEALNGRVPSLYTWFDVEMDYANTIDVDTLTAICSAFITRCNETKYTNENGELIGHDAGIYSSYWALRYNIDTSALASYVPYWVADYSRYNNFKYEHPELNVKMWQKSDTYNLNGYVYDLNEWYEG